MSDSPEQIIMGAIYMFLQEQDFEPTWREPFPSDTFAVASRPMDVECAPSMFLIKLNGAELMLTRTDTIPDTCTHYNRAFYGGEVRFLELADPGLFDQVMKVLS